MRRVAALDVVLVEPKELLGVERRGAAVDLGDVEQLHHLVEREELAVAVRPPNPAQVVEHGLGQVAVGSKLEHAHRAVALGEALPVRTENHGHVGIQGQVRAQRIQNIDLARGVVHVVVAADDVRHLHVQIVDDHREVIGRRAVGAHDDQIVELVVAEFQPPADEIVHHDDAIQRVLEPDDRRDAFGRRFRAIATAPVVARLDLACHLFRTQRFEAPLRAVAAVGLAFVEESLGHFRVAREAAALKDRPVVVVEPEPGEPLQDGIDGLLR